MKLRTTSFLSLKLFLLLLFPYFSHFFIPSVSLELQGRGNKKTLAWSSQNKVTHFLKDEQNECYYTYVKVTCSRQLENEDSRKVKTRAHPSTRTRTFALSQEASGRPWLARMGQPPKHGTAWRREDSVSREADRKHPAKEWPPQTLPHSFIVFQGGWTNLTSISMGKNTCSHIWLSASIL